MGFQWAESVPTLPIRYEWKGIHANSASRILDVTNGAIYTLEFQGVNGQQYD